MWVTCLLGNWSSWGLHFPRSVKGSDVDFPICLNTLFHSSSKMTCSKLFFYILYLANSNAKHQPNLLHKKKKSRKSFVLWLHVSECTFRFVLFNQYIASKKKLHKTTTRILKMPDNNLCLIENFQTVLNYHCLQDLHLQCLFYIPILYNLWSFDNYPRVLCVRVKKSLLEISKFKLEGPQKVGWQTVHHCVIVPRLEPLCCILQDIRKKPEMSVS